MIRTIENNSKEETKEAQLTELMKHFENSGYNRNTLDELKTKAIAKTTTATEETTNNTENNTLVFPMYFFDGINQFKELIRNLKDDFEQLIGDTRVMIATKKESSIENTLVRNKRLCMETVEPNQNQKCNAPGCRQCPLVNTQHKQMINNINISIPRTLNCKTRNVIYLWKCKLCPSNNSYFGRTTQKCNARTNGHRGCFNNEKWESSALSMHAKEAHSANFSLENFEVSVVRKSSPQNIRREEYRYIEKYRTIQLGLDRYKAF